MLRSFLGTPRTEFGDLSPPSQSLLFSSCVTQSLPISESLLLHQQHRENTHKSYLQLEGPNQTEPYLQLEGPNRTDVKMYCKSSKNYKKVQLWFLIQHYPSINQFVKSLRGLPYSTKQSRSFHKYLHALCLKVRLTHVICSFFYNTSIF